MVLTVGQLTIIHCRESGMPVAEIARIRGVTAEAIRKSLARAVRTLRKAQEDHLEYGQDPSWVTQLLVKLTK